MPAIYRSNQLATGKGELSIRWTDVNGRVVDDRRLPVELLDENEIGFTLDLRRAVSMRNELTAHFHFEGVNKKGEPDRRDEDVKREFIASPPDRQWWDYSSAVGSKEVPGDFGLVPTTRIATAQRFSRRVVSSGSRG